LHDKQNPGADGAQDQGKVQAGMSEFSKVCEEPRTSCGLKRSRFSSLEPTAPVFTSLRSHSHRIDRSQFSDLVFTSLSEAIRVWEDTRDEKVRNNLPKFNILASVKTWSKPKPTKGENSSKTFSIGN
jgi:hypothetical protein